MSTTSIADVDLTDISLWTHDVPWDLFARCRKEQPVHWSPMSDWPEEDGVWSVTRHADIARVSRDFATFSSERKGIAHATNMGIPLELQQQQMISIDPPRHDRLKALVQRAFTPRRVAAHADRIREIVVDCLTRITERDDPDLVRDVSKIVPARVIGSLLGTPPEDDARIVSWTSILAEFEQRKLFNTGTFPTEEESTAEFMAMWEYLMHAKATRLAEPKDDLITALVYAEIDGDKLTDGEFVMFCTLLMAAGNHSTGATYANTQLSLLRAPDQRAQIIDDPALIPIAVEEGLRMHPAFSFFARTATRDTELGGQAIAEGDKLLLWFLSGNRDEDVFDRPDCFDVRRSDYDRHQAFGAGGRHFCLGASLARLELGILMEETLRRFPRMELAGEPTRVPSIFVNQPASVPVLLS